MLMRALSGKEDKVVEKSQQSFRKGKDADYNEMVYME